MKLLSSSAKVIGQNAGNLVSTGHNRLVNEPFLKQSRFHDDRLHSPFGNQECGSFHIFFNLLCKIQCAALCVRSGP